LRPASPRHIIPPAAPKPFTTETGHATECDIRTSSGSQGCRRRDLGGRSARPQAPRPERIARTHGALLRGRTDGAEL